MSLPEPSARRLRFQTQRALGGTSILVSLIVHGAFGGMLLIRSRSPATSAPSPAAATGETFELPAPVASLSELTEETTAASSPAGAETSAVPTSAVTPGPAPAPGGHRGDTSPQTAHHRRAPTTTATRATASSPELGDGATASAPFGAVGDRSATDLARAFTRGFPQAASGDPIWRTVPFGSAGEATLVLTLDDSGHITSERIVGSASPALMQAIQRTMALIRARPFTARGRITRLRLSATVVPNTVPDGLHGDVFAIGAGDDEGFFALSIGRRIDLRVRGARPE